MSDKLYADLGKKQERIEQLDAAYNALLGLLAGVVAGNIDRSRVLVNLTDRSWSLSAAGERPGLPATINGLPECVVAPPDAAPPEPAPDPERPVLVSDLSEDAGHESNGKVPPAVAERMGR